ncbi:MAG: EAL domain-containing protein [Pseudomonadota bacterium]|nr:EAL domain-containing protein [Pseudomonadota bacterium]
MNPVVFLITSDSALTKRLTHSLCKPGETAFSVECMDSIAEAIRRLKRDDRTDALIVDSDLPAMSGVESLMPVTDAAPQLPIIVLGDDRNMLHPMEWLERGAQDYVLKSCLDTDTLNGLIRRAIARKSRESALFCDKQRAQVILNSIGDGVLSTDGNHRVTFLNPVAEKLTGWTNAEAAGRMLTEIFQVINSATRERIVPRLEFEVKKGGTMILPPNSVLVRRDGRESPIADSAAPIHDQGGHVAGMVVVFHDVTEVQEMAQRMTHLAQHDVLTSLPNRALLDDRLQQGIALAQRYDRRLAFLFIDLDHFKHVNDSVGHLVGDQLLKEVASRITPCVRGSDTVSRQGGDEFVVLLSEVAHAEDAAIIADKIRLAVAEPYTIAGHFLQLTASIGIGVYPEDGTDAQTLIHCADTAMYHAKEQGRNNSQFFKDEMNHHAVQRQIIAGDLRRALARNEFTLAYQPKVDLASGAITGVEALIRWHHPSRGIVSPLQFIQIAEDCGLIVQIGRWVLRTACVQAKQWLAAGLGFGTVAVNISAVEFRNDGFFDHIREILMSTGLEPRYLELELTETAVMRDFEKTSTALQSLSRMGMRISVDDFGTGYSNLSYLKLFPIDTLKLDKSFVQDAPDSANIAIIVRSVIHMAQGLKLKVVAEGVESARQLKFLQACGCSEGQGYYFSKPVDPGECEALILAGERNWARQLPSRALRALK